MITKKTILISIGIVLALGIIAQAQSIPYGKVITQAQYDTINFTIKKLNFQIEKNRLGKIVPDCDKITQICSLNLTFDYFDKELALIYRPDIKGTLIPEYNETGRYIFVRKKRPITFSYSTYIYLTKQNRNAQAIIRKIILSKIYYKAYNTLDHLNKMQTITNSGINLGGSI